MSRFTHDIAEDEYVAYGLDRALGYFADVFVKFIDDDGLPSHEVTKSVTGRSNVLDLFDSLGIMKDMNQWHIKSICMDIQLASDQKEYDCNVRKIMGGI